MRFLTPILMALFVAGCTVDPQAKAEKRADLIEGLIPNPADRDGVYLVYPFENAGSISALYFVWEPSKISETKARQIVSGICARAGRSGSISIDKDLGTGTRTLPDGKTIAVREVWFGCEFD